MRVAKILTAGALATLAFFIIVKILGLENIFFRGPLTVIDLITDQGLDSDRGRINILVLGTGGAGHEGPDLTDTIILTSIDWDGQDVAMVSIPRDLWAPSLSAKINAAYAFGQTQGNGLALAKKTVRELFDLPIHYAARIDFDGFTRAVDLVGGLDINVDQGFSDYRYPVPGRENDTCGVDIKEATVQAAILEPENDLFPCRYENITFQKGLTHMDGVTALKFVRSRYGTGDEGSDFKRSARQQKVILAMRQKIFASQTLTNPETIINLIATFDKSIDTDIKSNKVPLFIKLAQKIETGKIRNIVLDGAPPESVLEIPDPASYGGQFVLAPKGGNWHDLAEYVQGEIFKLPD